MCTKEVLLLFIITLLILVQEKRILVHCYVIVCGIAYVHTHISLLSNQLLTMAM